MVAPRPRADEPPPADSGHAPEPLHRHIQARHYLWVAGTVLVVIFAVDLAAAEQRVRAAGGKIVKPIFSFPGGRRFHFADPSGNELAVWSDR